MSRKEEIIELQALRSDSQGRKQPASSNPLSAPFPRSRSSTTILLRSSSRVTPNHATEINEVGEKAMQVDIEKIRGTDKHESSFTRVAMADDQGVTEQNPSHQIDHVNSNLESHNGVNINDDRMLWYKMRRSTLCRRDVGMWRSTVVELMASLVLTFTSVAAVIACLRAEFTYPRIAVAITQFLIYTMCILAAAPLSGGHLNPSFSFACVLIGHITPLRGLLYILAQSAGSVIGALFVRATVPSGVAQMYYLGGCLLKQQVFDANLNAISSVGAGSGRALVAEFLFSFLLIAVALPLLILCPPTRGPKPSSSGQFLPLSMSNPLPSLQQKFTSYLDPALLTAAFIIGLLLGLLIFVSGQLLSPGYTSAGMNPARCFGPAVAEGGADLWRPQWVFWLGPFLAALLFALLYEGIFYNHPHKRSYTYNQWLASQGPTVEASLPLVGASESATCCTAQSRVDEIRQISNQMSDLRQSSSLTDSMQQISNQMSDLRQGSSLTDSMQRRMDDSMQRRMDVFLHIKATMQQPDPPAADESGKSIHALSVENGPLTPEAPISTADDHHHIILEHANLSLRHLMELPSTSSNSPTRKLERLLKDAESQ